MWIGRRRALGALAGAAIAVAMAAAAAGAVAASSTANVNMREVSDRYEFSPGTIHVTVGGTVTWDNTTDAPHTVTSDSGGTLASSTISPSATFSHTFNSIGTFAYHCTIHTYMKGEVVVQAAGATPPGTDTAGAATGSAPPVLPLFVMLLAGSAGALAIALRVRLAR